MFYYVQELLSAENEEELAEMLGMDIQSADDEFIEKVQRFMMLASKLEDSK